ncbi:hypothetical protein [Dactylosporangium sp. NPDC049140]|uniref:hypothetical protein n=1 Tax=Dactylosporangium sp. NPDC049140 TaxID=3155647 RepID=UPI0033DBCEF6
MTRTQRIIRVTVVLSLAVTVALGWKQYQENNREAEFKNEMARHGMLVVGQISRQNRVGYDNKGHRIGIPVAVVNYEVRGNPYSFEMDCRVDPCPLPVAKPTMNLWVNPDAPHALVTEDGYTNHRFDDTSYAYLLGAVGVLLIGAGIVFILVVTDQAFRGGQPKGPVV